MANRLSVLGTRAHRLWLFGLLFVSHSPLAVLCSAQSVPPSVREAESRRVAVFDKCSRAVVCIFADSAKAGGGSGVVISPDGYGLTNYHVVAEFVEKRRGVGGLSDGNLYPLRVLGIDPGGDIAMFKLEGKETFDYAPLGDSDTLVVGQYVAAMGNPFLTAEDFSPTITLGIISGLHRYQEGQGNLLEYADCIQVSTSINPGNSGGPLFDMDGRVIGINGRASFEERGRVNVGLGYAVTSNQIKRFMPGLRAGRLMEHGTLGMTVQQIGDDVVLNRLQELSPAEKAGLQLGDHILSVAGRPTRTANDFNNFIAIYPAGWPIAIRARREGRDVEAVARLERLAIRLPLVYLLDLEHNHVELRKILEHSDRALALPVDRKLDEVHLTGRVTQRTAAGEKSQPFELTLHISDPSADALPADAPAILNEWRAIIAPLLGQRRIDIDWEFLGGDEHAGRIVAVVERRLSNKERLHWRFDTETGAFSGATLEDAANKESAIWSAAEQVKGAPFQFPRIWTRRTEAGAIDALEIDTLEARFAAPDAEGRP